MRIEPQLPTSQANVISGCQAPLVSSRGTLLAPFFLRRICLLIPRYGIVVDQAELSPDSKPSMKIVGDNSLSQT